MEKTFGTQIRERREELELSLRDVANIIDMDFSQLSKIERGILLPPSVNDLNAILEALHFVKGTSEYIGLYVQAHMERGELVTIKGQSQDEVKELFVKQLTNYYENYNIYKFIEKELDFSMEYCIVDFITIGRNTIELYSAVKIPNELVVRIQESVSEVFGKYIVLFSKVMPVDC